MRNYKRTTKKTYIATGMLCGGFLVCASLYIYVVNESAVQTLAIEKTKKLVRETEEQLHILEIEQSRMTVGASLEQQAEQQNLVAARAIFFVSRGAAVAQLNR